MIWRILQWLTRLFLGGMFLYAGYAKLKEPFLFEIAVDSYQILPSWGVIAVARTLPWLEMVLGLILLAGWKLLYFSAFATGLIGFFLALMAVSYSRGIEATCGCFGFGETVSAWTLERDSMIFVVALYLTVYSWITRRARATPAVGEAEPVA